MDDAVNFTRRRDSAPCFNCAIPKPDPILYDKEQQNTFHDLERGNRGEGASSLCEENITCDEEADEREGLSG